MRRDSIFYQLFSRSPSLLFNFVPNPPATAEGYKFESVAVKELKFEIDGVFLPPDTGEPGTVFFCEVQFQKDETLYERLFAELFLYFRMSGDRFSDWQAVVIYPSRSLEQQRLHPYRNLVTSDQFHRVYLDELGAFEQLPIPIALTVLTTLKDKPIQQKARNLVERTQRSGLSAAQQQSILDMVVSILTYKFTKLSRREVEAMIGITFQQTRVYQEIKEEGLQEGRQEAREEDRVKLLQLSQKLLQKRFGQAIPWKAGLTRLDFDTLTELGETLLDFESPQALLQALILDPGSTRVRQNIPLLLVSGVLGELDPTATERLQALTVDEALELVECLVAAQSLAQLRKALREWLGKG